MTIIRPIAPAILALIFFALFGDSRSPAARADDVDLALVGAKVYMSPSEPPIADGTVIVHAGKIAAVGKTGEISVPGGAKRIDCKGRFLTAGFQNSHVHFDEPDKWANAANIPAVTLAQRLTAMLTRYGFTTVVDTGSMLANTVEIRKRVESGEVAGPRILTAGGPLFPPDGTPFYLKNSLPPEILKQLGQPETPEAAVRMVDDDLNGGADIIKLFTGSLVERDKVKPMPEEIAKAAVEEAHRQGRLVFAHPSNIEGVMVAVDAQVDVLAHTTSVAGAWSPELIGRMKAQKMSLIPTLKLWVYEAKKGGASDEQALGFAKRNAENLRRYAEAGGQILFGTDVGYMTEYDPKKEYELMAGAGMPPMRILESLTTAPAVRFGESNRRGRIAVGMDADLVVLKADPAEDARNFANVLFAIRRGRAIYSAPAKP